MYPFEMAIKYRLWLFRFIFMQKSVERLTSVAGQTTSVFIIKNFLLFW